MSFYSKYILPKYLNLTMQGGDKEKQRVEVVSPACGTVLEIGFGSGLNLPYYKNITKLYALDPAAGSYQLAKERLQKVFFDVEYLPVGAEHIPLADNSVDYIVSTWSLCSIPEPEKALKEMYRVLKPVGRFLFVEHGKSPHTIPSLIQIIGTPISKCIGGGCHLDRKIDELIEVSGFSFEKIEKFAMTGKPLAFVYKGIGLKK